MRVIVFGDLHFRSEEPFYSVSKNFVDWFVGNPGFNSKENIGFFLGDIFHKPNNDGKTMHLAVDAFFNQLNFHKIYILRGNHDFNSKSDALEVFDAFDNIEVIREPKVLNIENTRAVCLPYLYRYSMQEKESGNRISLKEYYGSSETFEELGGLSYDYIFGHFTDETGSNLFEDADISFLEGKRIFGHLHSPPNDNYLGTPYRTRYDERNFNDPVLLSIDPVEKSESIIMIPELLSYKEIRFGDDVPEVEEEVLWTVVDAPSEYDAYEHYPDLRIREIKLKNKVQERKPLESTINGEGLSLEELFDRYVQVNQVSEPVQEILKEELNNYANLRIST